MPVLLSKYLDFSKVGDTGKTGVYRIASKSSGLTLGGISWYGPWRQYCFYANNETIFNRDCLHDIEDFLRQLMHERVMARFDARYKKKDK